MAHRSGLPGSPKAPLVKKVLKEIRELHPQQEKQAKPLQPEQLKQLVRFLDEQIHEEVIDSERHRYRRDKALVLIGFWRGFRSDELRRLNIENIEIFPGEGMTLYIPGSKNDRNNLGHTYKLPTLSQICPVDAYLDWVHGVGLKEGPVFRRIDRWGNIGNGALHANPGGAGSFFVPTDNQSIYIDTLSLSNNPAQGLNSENQGGTTPG